MSLIGPLGVNIGASMIEFGVYYVYTRIGTLKNSMASTLHTSEISLWVSGSGFRFSGFRISRV